MICNIIVPCIQKSW